VVSKEPRRCYRKLRVGNMIEKEQTDEFKGEERSRDAKTLENKTRIYIPSTFRVSSNVYPVRPTQKETRHLQVQHPHEPRHVFLEAAG
jgi:hypothetical protein